MKSVTKAAKAKVRPLPPEDPDTQAHYLLPGMHLRMGLGPRGWQRTVVPTRLGRRLRRLVHIQVPELRTWWDRGTVYSREMERNRNAKVSHRRSAASIFSEPEELGTPAGGGKPWTPGSRWAPSSLRSPEPKDSSNRTQQS